jgi:hypothetical protein
MALSCFFAAVFVLNVPRFLRFSVFGFFFREYSRYLPDFSFLIMGIPLHGATCANLTPVSPPNIRSAFENRAR